MKLVHDTSYSIREVTPSTSDTVPISEVMISGTRTGKMVSGAVFEAALKWNDHVLLFLTDDVPFEDGLNIHLLDSNLNIVDSAHMAFMYTTGIFSDLDLTQSDMVRFRFLGEFTWTLRLFPKKSFALPIVSDPLGVHRRFKFFRMFKIGHTP